MSSNHINSTESTFLKLEQSIKNVSETNLATGNSHGDSYHKLYAFTSRNWRKNTPNHEADSTSSEPKPSQNELKLRVQTQQSK